MFEITLENLYDEIQAIKTYQDKRFAEIGSSFEAVNSRLDDIESNLEVVTAILHEQTAIFNHLVLHLNLPPT